MWREGDIVHDQAVFQNSSLGRNACVRFHCHFSTKFDTLTQREREPYRRTGPQLNMYTPGL